MRFVPLLVAFAFGCAATWLLTRAMPQSGEVSPTVVAGSPTIGRDDPSPTALVDFEEEVGIPADAATGVRSHPGAGQQRALARALEAFERPPSAPAAADHPELAAELAAKIRNHFNQGEQP